MIYLLPFISGLIGWITNWIAVKMLFHPREPLDLKIFTLQGIFPKRQKVLAEKLGKVVAVELFSFDDIYNAITDPSVMTELLMVVEGKMDVFLEREAKRKYACDEPFYHGQE